MVDVLLERTWNRSSYRRRRDSEPDRCRGEVRGAVLTPQGTSFHERARVGAALRPGDSRPRDGDSERDAEGERRRGHGVVWPGWAGADGAAGGGTDAQRGGGHMVGLCAAQGVGEAGGCSVVWALSPTATDGMVVYQTWTNPKTST